MNLLQALIDKRAVASGHDISDGGIVVALLEMAFAGNCGIDVNLPKPNHDTPHDANLAALFAEEIGLLLEVFTLCIYPFTFLSEVIRLDRLHICEVQSHISELFLNLICGQFGGGHVSYSNSPQWYI